MTLVLIAELTVDKCFGSGHVLFYPNPKDFVRSSIAFLVPAGIQAITSAAAAERKVMAKFNRTCSQALNDLGGVDSRLVRRAVAIEKKRVTKTLIWAGSFSFVTKVVISGINTPTAMAIRVLTFTITYLIGTGGPSGKPSRTPDLKPPSSEHGKAPTCPAMTAGAMASGPGIRPPKGVCVIEGATVSMDPLRQATDWMGLLTRSGTWSPSLAAEGYSVSPMP
jgi:hypothetical protein